jgi:ligand-binding sensor domain-containing protein
MLSDRTVEAEQRIVQYDQFAGYLFSNESILAMAVDGANRKWIGTANGLWLLSPDASKVISRFTVDNSPLPSNIIQSIAVDATTGDVYFGTQDGLVSYRGTATEGAESASDIKTFPSPVPSGYTGPVTLKGFTTDADVRITDIAGQLIYRAKATGGQLVWNGLDYTGHRPQTGVLLIFATNRDGTQTAVGKMMMMH